MPKILPDQREIFLANARRILKEEGYAALSIRRLAEESGAASGTLYNYFHSKDELIAEVMLDDWRAVLQEMKEAAQTAENFPDGLTEISGSLGTFARQNMQMWRQYLSMGGSSEMIAEHHGVLRGQIEEPVRLLIRRKGDEGLLAESPLLAELVLAAAMHPELDPSLLRGMAERMVR